MRKKRTTVRNKNDVSSKKRKVVKKKAATRKTRTPKTRNNNTLTESEYFSKIRSALRNAFRYWKPMQKSLDLASRPSQSTNTRLKKEYQCAHCKKWWPRKDVEIDHIEACGSLKCYEDVVPFIQRLTVESPDAYQVLCKKDHLKKTKEDNIKRKSI